MTTLPNVTFSEEGDILYVALSDSSDLYDPGLWR